MGNADTRLVSESLFNLINEAHLFNGFKRACDQALTAIKAGVFNNVMLSTETTTNGVNGAEFRARIATDATVLIDMDDATEFSLSEITLVSGSVFSVGVGAREVRTNRDRIVGH